MIEGEITLKCTKRIKELTQQIQQDFPALFPAKPALKVALKVGIYEDLHEWALARGASDEELGAVLHYWCRGYRYKLALLAGKRHGLHGEISDVAPIVRKRAAIELSYRREYTGAVLRYILEVQR